MKLFTVTATYPAADYSVEKDQLIAKAAGYDDDGAGCGGGGRDVQFDFKDEKTAKMVSWRIRSANIPGVKVKTMEWDDED